MSGTICDLARHLPDLVAVLLDRESFLQRGRFREETFTDFLTGSLATFAGPNLVIQYPIEASTGGDLDLDFHNLTLNQRVRLRIQAKRLSPENDRGRTVGIQARSYRELLHYVPSGRHYQYDILTDSSSPPTPLYMFYNHASAVATFRSSEPTSLVRGINLAFARDVAAELNKIVVGLNSTPRRVLPYKRLSHLQPLLFDLSAILCPPGSWEGSPVPTPDAVASSLTAIWAAMASRSQETDDKSESRLLHEPPNLLELDMDPNEHITEGPAVRVNGDLIRPKITVISRTFKKESEQGRRNLRTPPPDR